MRHLFTTLVICLFCAYAGAQEVSVSHGSSGHASDRTLFENLNLTGIWGGPTYNYSSTGDDWALVRGGMGGLEFGNNLFLGYGGWKSRDRFSTNEPLAGGLEPTYEFRHGGFVIGVAPGGSQDNAIHPRFTALLGPGRIVIDDEFTDIDGAEESERFFVGQIMGGLELNVTEWFRLGFEGGYRFAGGVDNELVTARDISGAVIQVEARFGFSW